MGYSIDCWGRRGQGEWRAPTEGGEGAELTQTGDQKGCRQREPGATCWMPAGPWKAGEVNKQAAPIHTSHF